MLKRTRHNNNNEVRSATHSNSLKNNPAHPGHPFHLHPTADQMHPIKTVGAKI